jgi:hypothetical protein
MPQNLAFSFLNFSLEQGEFGAKALEANEISTLDKQFLTISHLS